MANEQEQPNTQEPLGSAYEALQRRLLDDGAAWRAELPSTERLEQRLKTLMRQAQTTRPDAEAQERLSRLRLIDRTKGEPPMLHGRLRTITAAVAIAAVVALFVVLFQGFGVGRGHSSTASPTHTTPTLTASATPTPTPQPNQLAFLPLIAPSDPHIVYRLMLANDSAVQLVLQASADGGATWHNFALPAQSNGPQPTLFVSPLDARRVFVSIGGTLVNTVCMPQGVNGNSTLSTGNNVCGLQYVSQDGGAHWTQLHLASNAVLSYFALPTFNSATSIYPFQAQGTRLYAALGPWETGAYIPNQAGPSLVASDDGGLTWQEVDNGLPLPADTLCDTAPAPTGSTIFVLVAPTSATQGSECDGGDLTLWRSDDAGAHWAKVGPVKGNVDLGMTVVNNGNAAQPLLYLNVGSTICPNSAYIAGTPASSICGGSPTNLQVSADGGKTWHAAPTQGYPDQKLNPGHPLGVLNDGSVLFLVDSQFYSWKSGAVSWQRVGPTVSAGFQYALVTTASSGQQTLWVVTSPGSSAYAIKSYTL